MIPVNEPLLLDAERRNVEECIATGWISSEGKFITEFEQKWARFCGREHGVAVSNGSVALEAAIWSLGLKPGDEVVVPTFTIISCLTAILRNELVPVLVDSDEETWCMNVGHVAAKLTPRTRAIMPVHIYGHPVDLDPLLALAASKGIHVVEDAAEAHGAEYKGKKCGSFGDVSTFSFYANKLITTGEGGMVLTNDRELAERLRSYRNLCFRKDRRFYHTELGNNYRLTNVQAAIGSAQVDRIDQIVEKKREMGRMYNDLLGGCKYLRLPSERPWAKNIYWMYGVVLHEDSGLNAADFASLLLKEGIHTRPFFLGMHEQPVFLNRGLFRGEKYPVAERIARQGFYLPSGLPITPDQIRTVSSTVRRLLA
jgi:perosamine synthetase